MTFKNTNFSDSPVMRSLEKVALSKGLIKNDPIKKEASAVDLKITPNLISNLLKLANGLRSKNLISQAEELEDRIICYKKSLASIPYAEILDQAHPKSNKLENLQHTVNTLIDNQLEILHSVNNQAKGKIANKKILNRIAQILNLNSKPESNSTETQLNLTDAAWVSEDGLRCNSKFINDKLEPQALSLNETLKYLNNLKSLSTDKRFNPEVSKAVMASMNVILNLLKNYTTACKSAYSQARELEKDRLQNIHDVNQSRVSFSEVGSNFKNGVLAKVNVGKATTFLGVEGAIIALKKDLGNVIFTKLSPGFDFDEDFMQGIKNKGFEYLNAIKQVLGS